MFRAGREPRSHLRRGFAGTAGPVSVGGIAVPLAFGVALTLAVRGHVGVSAPGVSVGVSGAIEAVPTIVGSGTARDGRPVASLPHDAG